MPSLLDKAKMPIGKNIKDKLDNWINENINVPLSKAGHENTGAAISAALSAGGELLIPDSIADAALALVPGAKLLKAGKKGFKALAKLEPVAEKALKGANKLDYSAIKAAEKAAEKAAPVLDYGKMKAEEQAARNAKRQMFDKMSTTLQYDKFGNIKNVKK